MKHDTKELKDAYFELQNSCGIIKGDIVKVVSGLPIGGHKFGWDVNWAPEMDKFVNDGNEYVVCDVSNVGFRLIDSWVFPAFCLELVKKAFKKPIFTIPNSSYNAVVEEDGTVVVGCQKISPDLLFKIAEAVNKAIAITGHFAPGTAEETKNKIVASLLPNQRLLAKDEILKSGDIIINERGSNCGLTSYIGCKVASGANYTYIRSK